MALIEQVKDLIARVENDKWITIKPNGEITTNYKFS